jgi:hypothetical protein
MHLTISADENVSNLLTLPEGTSPCNVEKESRDEIDVAKQLHRRIRDSRSMSKPHIR